MHRAMIAGLAVMLVVAACADDDSAPANTAAPAAASTTAPRATMVTTTTQSDGGQPTTSAPATTPSTTEPASDSSTTTTRTDTPTDTPTETTTTEAPPPSTVPRSLADLPLAATTVIDGLESPVFLTAPRGDHRLFVVEQPGRILVFDDGETGVFLDVTDRVGFGGERGLLGLAFHPSYVDNRRFYVNYTDRDGTSVISEFQTDPVEPGRADPAAERVLLTVPQPAGNHNGGMVAFGPEGHLYIALGDGGAANDRFGNGQRPDTLLGTILRIDVDGGDPYAIPSGNPFASGDDGAPEVWAWGLRNPWRFSFDDEDVYIGDVGQGTWEEIDVVTAGTPGVNFGWPILEASECFGADDCDRTGLTEPVYFYDHDDGSCSVTGGYVYRGTQIDGLVGAYLFADFCAGVVTGFRLDGEGVYDVRRWEDTLTIPRITSFGTDGFGELYVVSQQGTVSKIVEGS